MANPGLSQDMAAEAVARVEQKLKEGFRPPEMSGSGPSAVGAAAEQAAREGWVNSRVTFSARLATAKERYGLEPDYSAYRPRIYQHRSPGEPIVPDQSHTTEPPPEGDPIRVAVIGDAHDSPHLRDKSRFTWLGAYIAEHGIERVVQIGDWLTLDSLSTHTDPATHEGLSKPSFQQDLDSFHESQRAFQAGLGSHKPIKDWIEGNHEYRAKRWANQHREVIGVAIDPAFAILEAFAQWGWRATAFGEYRFIGGVGFVHAPLVPGTNGKTYGGKTGGQRAANDAMFDIVRGDDHKFYVNSSPKIGPVKSPRIFGCATAFPPGYIETYARKNPGDWESGICDLTIWGGRVRSFAFTDMSLLQRRYGQKVAA